MEIERKYLLKQLPSNLDSYTSKKIAQGYLCTSPVVRVRCSNDSYYMTYKGAGLMVREEYNLPLTKEAYDHLVQKIDGRLIEKTRYLIPLDGGLTAELSVPACHSALTFLPALMQFHYQRTGYLPYQSSLLNL